MKTCKSSFKCKPTRMATAVVLAIGGLTVAGQVMAEEQAAKELSVMTITGGQEGIRDIPGSAHRMDREDIDRMGYNDPGKILREVPGVNIAEEEGLGQFPHISMRGVRPERNGRITAMEDGVLVASPAPYSAPAAYYFPPMAKMDSVEVRKGSSAIKYGPNTVGGALNMITTPIPYERSGRVRVQSGSNNGLRTHAYVGGTEKEQWGWLIENYSLRTDGFKEVDTPYSGRNSNKPNNPEPEAGVEQQNTMVKLRWNSAPEAEIYQEVEFKYAVDDRRIYDSYLGLTLEDYNSNPYRRYAGSQLDEINTENELFQLRHFIELTPDTDITTTLYRSDTVRNWYKLHRVRDSGGDRVNIAPILENPQDYSEQMAWIKGSNANDSTGYVRANNREYIAQGFQLNINHRFDALGWSHHLDTGFRYHEDEEDRLQWEDQYRMSEEGSMYLVEHGVPGETTNRLTETEALAFHLQNTMKKDAWTVQAGVRYEDIETTRRDWSGAQRNAGTLDANRPRSNSTNVFIPGLGATYQLNDQWSTLAGYHRGFAPAGDNPDTKTEESDSFEVGVRFADKYTRGELIAFYNDYSNINIECTSVGGGCSDGDIGSTLSAGEVVIYGLEASLAHDLGQSQGWAVQVPLRLNYTLTDSEFQQNIGSTAPNQWENARKGDRLPEIPQHQLNLGVGVAQDDQWAVNLNAHYTSSVKSFADPDKSNLEIDSKVLFDLSGLYQLKEDIYLTANVENLLDTEYVAHHRPAGVRPGAPRTLWAGVRVDF